MKPAKTAHRRYENSNLLVIRDDNKSRTSRLKEIVNEFNGNEVLVVNQSGTLPSSFFGMHLASQTRIELRLAAYQGPELGSLVKWLAVAFGDGSWRTPTGGRKAPRKLSKGDRVMIGPDLFVEIEGVDAQFNRLAQIRFHSDSLEKNLYRYGRPIQYSYLQENLEVWDQQTLFSGPPISVEPPSATLNFSWKQIFALQEKGVEIVPILHGAGLSSTGSEELDQKLPLAEWFSIGQDAANRLNRARHEGRKIIALGTSVTRALESSWVDEKVLAQSGLTEIKIGEKHSLQVTDGLVTGMHEPGTSHLELLGSFCSKEKTKQLYELVIRKGFVGHEYGDLSFLKCRAG